VSSSQTLPTVCTLLLKYLTCRAVNTTSEHLPHAAVLPRKWDFARFVRLFYHAGFLAQA